MERRRRTGIEVQDILDDIEPRGLRQTRRAELKLDDRAGRLRLTECQAARQPERQDDDQRHPTRVSSLDLHVRASFLYAGECLEYHRDPSLCEWCYYSILARACGDTL